MEWIKQRIEAQVLNITMASKEKGGVDFLNPPGDPGLFGPASACWEVHSDFTSMLIGGISALLLQVLHPLALSGVWDHSNFRQDILSRLRRTAHFISVTTFGSSTDAERAISRVEKIHKYIVGVAPDGRRYAANHPELLTWVHVAEVYSFLRAHLRYKNPHLSPERQDQYLSEYALVARKLGACNVPESMAEIESYMTARRSELSCDERAREVAQLVLNAPAPSAMALPWTRLMMRVGIDLLPDWALQMLGFPRYNVAVRKGMRLAVIAAAKPLRWSIRNGSAQLAKRRMGINA